MSVKCQLCVPVGRAHRRGPPFFDHKVPRAGLCESTSPLPSDSRPSLGTPCPRRSVLTEGGGGDVCTHSLFPLTTHCISIELKRSGFFCWEQRWCGRKDMQTRQQTRCRVQHKQLSFYLPQWKEIRAKQFFFIMYACTILNPFKLAHECMQHSLGSALSSFITHVFMKAEE